MIYYKGSRYEKVKEYIAKDAGGEANRIKRIRNIEKLDHAFTYTVQEGDRLDLLAYKFFGDPTKFWLICDANEEMFPPDLIKPGRSIKIPEENI